MLLLLQNLAADILIDILLAFVTDPEPEPGQVKMLDRTKCTRNGA